MFNPHNLTGGEGKITPQADLFAALAEPHGIDRYPLVTFHKYVWAMRWHNPDMSITIPNSNMAAPKSNGVTWILGPAFHWDRWEYFAT